MKANKINRRGHSVQATWPESGRTYTYNSITALTRVLSGTGEVNSHLRGQITHSALVGKPIRGIYVEYA